MYGRKACQLVKELTTGEKGQLMPFNVSPGDLVLMCPFDVHCFFEVIGDNTLYDILYYYK